jgi:hypothetical protein
LDGTLVQTETLGLPLFLPSFGFWHSSRLPRETVSRFHLAFLIFIAVLIYLLFNAVNHVWDFIDHSALWQKI